MGWDGSHISSFPGIRDHLKEMFTWRDSGRRITLLDHAVVNRNVAYCAIKVEHLDGDGVTSWSIEGSVVLYRFTRNEYMKKAISEDAGPAEDECPERILNLLTPTTNDWASKWRARCRKRIEMRKFDMKPELELINFDTSRKFTLIKKFHGQSWLCREDNKYGEYTVTKKWLTKHGFYPIETVFSNAL